MTELEKKYQNFEIYFRQFSIDQLIKSLNRGIQFSNQRLDQDAHLTAIVKVLKSRGVDCHQFERYYANRQEEFTSLQIVLVPTV